MGLEPREEMLVCWLVVKIGAKDSSNSLVAGSLRSFPQDSCDLMELCQVKLMIGGTGEAFSSAYSQTVNGHGTGVTLVNLRARVRVASGPLLVSRTGDAGCSESVLKVSEWWLM